jgi:hypothetical protein
MEVRKMMRFETRAGRIRRGVPIFVTWSPDENRNVVMTRMHRARANDPIHTLDRKLKSFGERLQSSIDQDYVTMAIPVEDVGRWLPNYDDRRAILARDGLASVDGSGRAFCSYVSLCGDREFAPCARIVTVEMQTMAARISSEATLSPKVAS